MEEDASPPVAENHSWNATCKRHLLVATIIALFQVILLYPLHETMDIPAWDEAYYLGQGGALTTGHSDSLPPLDGSPLYVLTYSLLIRLIEPVTSLFVITYGLAVAVAVLLSMFLMRVSGSCTVSLFLGAVWVVSAFNAHLEFPLVYRLGLALMLLALAYAGRPAVVTPLLVLATLARLEYALVLFAYMLFRMYRSARLLKSFRKPSIRGLLSAFKRAVSVPALILCVPVLVILLRLDGWHSGAGRAWFAFRQHYAVEQVNAGRSTIDPWIDYQLLTEDTFPGCQSLTGALQENPRALLLHVLTMVLRTPSSAGAFLNPAPSLTSWFALGAMALFVGALGVAGLTLGRSILGDAASSQWSRSRAVLTLSLLGLPALLPGLLIYSRPAYLLPIVPAIFGFLSLLLVTIKRALAAQYPHASIGRAFRAGGVIAAAAVMLVAIAGRTDLRPPGRQPNLEAVRLLEEILPDRPVTLLGLDQASYCDYLGRHRCTAVSMVRATTGVGGATRHDLRTLITQHAPDIVWLDNRVVGSSSFDAGSIDVLDSPAWSMYGLHGSSMFFRAESGFRDKIPIHRQVSPDGFNVSDGLAVDLGEGWYGFSKQAEQRWMRSPATLYVEAREAGDAVLSTRTANLHEAGGLGSRGILQVELVGAPVRSVPVRVSSLSEIPLSLRRGWNKLTLTLAAGNFTPSLSSPPLADHRSLSISFSSLSIASERPHREPAGFVSSANLGIKLGGPSAVATFCFSTLGTPTP